MTRYFAPAALLPHGWAAGVTIDVASHGEIAAIRSGAPPADAVRLRGPVLPGMPNIHSHAFQYAFAGSAERGGEAKRDSFWTWRETMYGFVSRLAPDHIAAIAAYVYRQMLKAGYTAVGEFHYLHHAADGARFTRRTEMADRVRAAAQESGIGLTLLPVLYEYAGFGAQPARPEQRRFTMDLDEFVAYWDELARTQRADPQQRLGVAPHSLRAVAPSELRALIAHVVARDPNIPIHIHIAEQQAEVDDCLQWSGQRPIAWLFDHAPVTAHWCLVHATHAVPVELIAMAEVGAVAGLCPTTEANLGDGTFEAEAFLERSGVIGVGSDSHVSIDVAEELRWLEYGRRLQLKRRAVLCDQTHPSVGGRIYRAAAVGGARALGRPIGRLEPHARADLLVLDAGDAALEGIEGDEILDRFIFGAARNALCDVMVGGRWVVRDRIHIQEEEIERGYRAALRALRA